LLTEVAVFLLAVRRERNRWREQTERQRLWASIKDAVRMVPELAALMKRFEKSRK